MTNIGELSQPLPSDPIGLTVDWMQEAFDHTGASNGARLRSISFAGYIGTGQMGRTARYQLQWDGDGAPSTVVGKFPTDEPTGRASGFAGSYQKEWIFYRDLASTVDVRAPRCYFAAFDEPGQNFVLLMEDMAGSQQGDQMRGLGVDEANLAIEQAVALHAPRWGDPTLAALTFGQPSQPTAAEASGRLDMFYNGCIEPTLARLGPHLTTDVMELARAFAPKTGAWVTAIDVPLTMVHMDFRPDNFLFGVSPDAPPLAIVDWQTVAVGAGTHDIAYMIGGGFEPDMRRNVERELVQSYCTQLAARGIDYPFERCWEHYRISALWGVIMSVLATVLASQTERGDQMFVTMLRRHATHARDLDSLSLFG